MKTTMKTLAMALLTSCISAQVFGAAFLSSTFSEVNVDNIQPGRRYSMKKLASFPYNISNKGKIPAQLALDIIKPGADQLKDGYEVIPDTSWIKLETNRITVNPGETKRVDVYIYVPDNAKYLGKKYEADIWAHTIEAVEGLPVAVGLQSRLLLTTAKVYDAAQRQFGFIIEPENIYLDGVDAGKLIDVLRIASSSLKVTNEYNEPVEFNAETVKNDYPKGQDDSRFVRDTSIDLQVEPRSFKLQPFETGRINFKVTVPEQRANTGKRLLWVVRISPTGKYGNPKYFRLYLTLK